MSEKSTAEQVADLRRRWNPAPQDHLQERVVGIPVPEGDGRVTNHEPMEITNAHITAGSGDPLDDDDEGPEDYSDYDHQALKDEIDQRNEDRDEDTRISKAGSSDDLRARLIEDDQDDEDDDEEE